MVPGLVCVPLIIGPNEATRVNPDRASVWSTTRGET